MIERRDDSAFQRYRRRVWLAIAVQGIAFAVAVGLGYHENSQRIDDNRRSNCTQNEGIVAYITALGANEQQIRNARQFFPDCS